MARNLLAPSLGMVAIAAHAVPGHRRKGNRSWIQSHSFKAVDTSRVESAQLFAKENMCSFSELGKAAQQARQKELMIPVHCDLSVRRSQIASHSSVASEMQCAIRTCLEPSLPDIEIAHQLSSQLAEEVCDGIEQGVNASHKDNMLMEWAFDYDLDGVTVETGSLTTIAMMDGAACLRLCKTSTEQDGQAKIGLRINLKCIFLDRNQVE
jgi:hypothetical protein